MAKVTVKQKFVNYFWEWFKSNPDSVTGSLKTGRSSAITAQYRAAEGRRGNCVLNKAEMEKFDLNLANLL